MEEVEGSSAHPAKGSLLKAQEVGGCTVQQSHCDVDGRHRPWEGEVVEDLLVPQVEPDVQAIPAHQNEGSDAAAGR